ncbi:MAG: iron-sulfur cluster biosynthesis family protein [Thiobacillus sp.]|jgi:iron-sulfur cluster assembly protein|uniref:HesB/IscA family protein n=1 Tax=Thiobacillus sp. TaxID=924 RepID=UPI002894CA59|nr:iron-sulfur cluster biosynthesis family protein [Thiobacillus sp.]MDT3705758.1 iron-sulfur cluster biosynthesis family protein [Thiobacillus sp.]
MIKITDAAAAQIRAANNNPDVYEMILRVAAYQEDDGNVNYGMGFDTEREADEHLIVNGVQLLIAPQSTPYLQGVTIDFVEMSPGDMRFIFIPPYSAEPEPEADATPAE